ncbi:MAG: hypothetical protein JO108_13235 [Acidobacteriaceae bacterium]|nr:hypothetical protein [Acidobacteriaceae bacterium]
MTLESFIRYGSLWTLILGVLSLAFAVRNYRRQVNAQIFFEIAGRYHEILRSFPVREWISRLNPKDEVSMSPELTSGVLRYLAIVHFAFVLHELRYLSKDLWKLLQAEHYRTLATPLFVHEWNTLRVEFTFFPTFLAYVDSIQRGPARLNPDMAILRGIAAIGAWRSFRRKPSTAHRDSSVGSDFPR